MNDPPQSRPTKGRGVTCRAVIASIGVCKGSTSREVQMRHGAATSGPSPLWGGVWRRGLHANELSPLYFRFFRSIVSRIATTAETNVPHPTPQGNPRYRPLQGKVLVEDLASRFRSRRRPIRKDLNELWKEKTAQSNSHGAPFSRPAPKTCNIQRRLIAATRRTRSAAPLRRSIPSNASLFGSISAPRRRRWRQALLDHGRLNGHYE